MNKRLETMTAIINENEKEIEAREQHPLDDEGVALAKHKRFTFDIISTPVDPLR